MEGADDPDAGQVFAGDGHDPIQLSLHPPVAGNGEGHDAEYDEKQHRDDGGENKRRPAVDGKGEDQRTEHNER